MTITDKANAFRRAMDPEVLAELVRLEVGGNPRPGQPRAKTEPHDPARAVDFDRIRFALDNPLLPVPETVQSALVAAVEPQPDPSTAEGGLWRPVEGKFGRTRDGERVRLEKNPDPTGIHDFIGYLDDGDFWYWHEDGCFERDQFSSRDLIAEWQDAPALEMRGECFDLWGLPQPKFHMERFGAVSWDARSELWRDQSGGEWDRRGKAVRLASQEAAE